MTTETYLQELRPDLPYAVGVRHVSYIPYPFCANYENFDYEFDSAALDLVTFDEPTPIFYVTPKTAGDHEVIISGTNRETGAPAKCRVRHDAKARRMPDWRAQREAGENYRLAQTRPLLQAYLSVSAANNAEMEKLGWPYRVGGFSFSWDEGEFQFYLGASRERPPLDAWRVYIYRSPKLHPETNRPIHRTNTYFRETVFEDLIDVDEIMSTLDAQGVPIPDGVEP